MSDALGIPLSLFPERITKSFDIVGKLNKKYAAGFPLHSPFVIHHPSSLDDNIFSFAEISYRLFDQFVQIFFVGFSVHGNIRVAARP